MSSKAITEKQQDREGPDGFPRIGESAPSLLRDDEQQWARWVGAVGLVAALVGGDILLWSVAHWSVIYGILRLIGYLAKFTPQAGPGPLSLVLAALFFVLGLAGLLFHASVEKEAQLRRVYGVAGGLWLVLGVVLFICNTLNVSWAAGPPISAIGSMLLGLGFLLAFVRNEKEADYRDAAVYVIGGAGALAALAGFIGGHVSGTFLVPHGVLLALVGVGFLWAFVVCRGASDGLASRVALGTAVLGLVVFYAALARSSAGGTYLGVGVGALIAAAVLPPLLPRDPAWEARTPTLRLALTAVGAVLVLLALAQLIWPWLRGYLYPPLPPGYFIPQGLTLMTLGLFYVALWVLFRVDYPLLILTRRELASIFYSPIAFLVLVGFTLVLWFQFWLFIDRIFYYQDFSPDGFTPGQPMLEPVVRQFFITLIYVIALLIIVPLLTMRALSEERRTGTLEMLLTVPVGEVPVVLSKFIALLIFFMTLFVPVALFLVSLAAETGRPFDYRPMLSFAIALACTGSGMLAMGLFFSALTQNQIISAVLTFAGMIALLAAYLSQQYVHGEGYTLLLGVLRHVSFIDSWETALEGKFMPQFLVFHVSAAVFWLFLTVKVLEARKWS
jgi:ABC-type transport system involved in multi-copper enzyme maturation permease subunit